jgi:hypothetical protein
MLTVDATYILVAVLSLLTGVYAGFRLGRHVGHSQALRVGLTVKNPEMWELLHYLVVDQDARETKTKTQHRQKGG